MKKAIFTCTTCGEPLKTIRLVLKDGSKTRESAPCFRCTHEIIARLALECGQRGLLKEYQK
jgi:DNA-directed RNA polymerase subunit RPC12/RpoP